MISQKYSEWAIIWLNSTYTKSSVCTKEKTYKLTEVSHFHWNIYSRGIAAWINNYTHTQTHRYKRVQIQKNIKYCYFNWNIFAKHLIRKCSLSASEWGLWAFNWLIWANIGRIFFWLVIKMGPCLKKKITGQKI